MVLFRIFDRSKKYYRRKKVRDAKKFEKISPDLILEIRYRAEISTLYHSSIGGIRDLKSKETAGLIGVESDGKNLFKGAAEVPKYSST